MTVTKALYNPAYWDAIAEQRTIDEAQRKIDLVEARELAQKLGQELTELRTSKFSTEYSDRNPAFVSDVEIDLLEARYRVAIQTLEQLDRE